MNRFKLYRWWRGGIWCYVDGLWLQPDNNGFIKYELFGNSYGCHMNYFGVTKREYYKNRKKG